MVITSTFIGYITAGIPGSLVATLCIFLPTFCFVVILAHGIARFKDNFYLKAFIKGANAAAIGAILSTAYMLSRSSIIDIPTIVLFLAAILILFKMKANTLLLIVIAAVCGILIKMYLISY